MDDDLVLLGIKVLMAFVAIDQRVEHLCGILPSRRIALPKKGVLAIGASRAAVAVSERGRDLYSLIGPTRIFTDRG